MFPILISKLHRKIHKAKTKIWLMCILTCTVALVVSYFILQKILFSQKLENSNDIPKSPLIRKNSEVSERILCYVPLVREKLRVAKVIKETWGSNCDELVFYGDTDNSELNIKNINVTEKYELLWGKTKAILVHLHNNYANGFDWFIKADDDTFVILENLRQFVYKLKPSEKDLPLWFGFKMKHQKMKNGYMSGGAGYVMNEKALSKFALFVEKHKDKDFVQYEPSKMERPEGCKTTTNEGIEDLELGRCFHSLGIGDIPTHDHLGRHRFLPISLLAMMSGNVDSGHWIWSQSWHPIKLVKYHYILPLIRQYYLAINADTFQLYYMPGFVISMSKF
ncbi:glycoprotein-N-acetylgalactosamine 3-beta-galactosyltransferase 1 isoform X1 [Folsomia candida]|uniref:glycoprotein-N-acetylgalactosamine 3-beta-galactosyltransferase 1 isoform X1 n=1 Tax=Folsomia candida TaxID=158441 RepID=UPI001604AC84|nr:glycoprotein-N-acetylgalactosamine 3-beta-galactosyltransferase 1 isoform X1 [Folsomia candida]